MARYRYRELGGLSWYGDIWMLYLLRIADRVLLGIHLFRLDREMTLMIGARVVQRFVCGNPPVFSGGLHFTVRLQWPLVRSDLPGRHGGTFRRDSRAGTAAIAAGRWMTK
jgi:hypothetical protein